MKISITLTADDIKFMMSRQYGFKESDMDIKNLDDHIIVECNGLPTSPIYSQPVIRGIGTINNPLSPTPTVTTDGINNIPLSVLNASSYDEMIDNAIYDHKMCEKKMRKGLK